MCRARRKKTRMHIDESVAGTSPADFDALFIPGGHSPHNLRAYDEAASFAGSFIDSGKPVFTPSATHRRSSSLCRN